MMIFAYIKRIKKLSSMKDFQLPSDYYNEKNIGQYVASGYDGVHFLILPYYSKTTNSA